LIVATHHRSFLALSLSDDDLALHFSTLSNGQIGRLAHGIRIETDSTWLSPKVSLTAARTPWVDPVQGDWDPTTHHRGNSI
jgi:hypothetical protein